MSAYVTNEEFERFERDGYLVFDPEIDEAVIDALPAELESRYPTVAGDAGHTHIRVHDAYRFSEGVRALATAPKVMGVLEGLYGREPRPFQTLNFRVGSEQATHSDTIHFNSEPRGFVCGVWIALEAIDLENGPLVYYPGSHKLPEVTMADVGVPATARYYPDYERYIAGVVETCGIQPRYGTLRKGQALVWASNLLHGGAPQRDRSRTRHSQVTHYFFSGCENHAPMLGTPSAPFAIHPARIRPGPPTPRDRAQRLINNLRLVARMRMAPFRWRARGQR